MIKKLFFTSALTILLILPAQVSAVPPTPPQKQKDLKGHFYKQVLGENDVNTTSDKKDWQEKLNEFKAAKEEQKLEKLKNLSTTLIDNRLNYLEKMSDRIEENTKIDDATRQELISNIEKNITELKTLKTTIDAETDIAKLKEEIKSIFEKFRIYMVFGPSSSGQSLVAKSQYITGRLDALAKKLQKTIDQKKNEGKDTTSIEKLMTDFNAKLADAKTQLTVANEKFKSMNPANTEAAKTAREEGKAAMKAAKQDG